MNSARVKGVFLRHIRDIKHSPSDLSDVLVWPFVDTILFGSTAAFFIARSDGAITIGFVLVGLFLYHVIFQVGTASSIAFMNETASRNILNLMTTPVTTVEYATGLILSGLTRAVCGITAIAVFAKLLFDFSIVTHPGVMLIALEMVFVGIGTSLLLIAMQVRLGHKAERLTWFISILIPTLSGAFYPIDALPGFIQPFSNALPTTQAFNAARQVIAGNGLDAGAVVIAGVGSAALMVIGALSLAWALRAFKRLGLVTRYS